MLALSAARNQGKAMYVCVCVCVCVHTEEEGLTDLQASSYTRTLSRSNVWLLDNVTTPSNRGNSVECLRKMIMYVCKDLSSPWSWARLQKPPIVYPLKNFMEPEGSLPCSQESSTGLYPESDRSSPYHTIPSYLSMIHFNIVHPPTS
jgi:hypothetical protein